MNILNWAVGLLIFLMGQPLLGQNYEYDVYWRSRQIGHIKAQQLQHSDSLSHHIRTEIVMPVLGRRILSQLESHYASKGLHWCRAKYSMDGEIKEDRLTRKQYQAYRLTRTDQDAKMLNATSIPFTISRLYFKEPKDLNQIYSERHQQFLNLERPEPGVYKVKLPEGKINHYHYDQGRLTKVEVQEGIFTVRFEASR